MVLCVAHTYCAEYFRLMQSLNALMLFKFFPSDPDGQRFAAMAVLYIRASEGHIVADAVSFGMRPLPSSAAVPPEIARVLRAVLDSQSHDWFPRPPCPWPAELRPMLLVPQEIVLGPNCAAGAAAGKAPSPAAGPCPLEVRL